MLKWMIRIGLILLVVALVSGAFILLAEKAGASLAALPGEGQHLRDSQGMGLGRQLRGRSENTLPQGSAPLGGERDRDRQHETTLGADWNGILMQLGKVAVITLLVVAAQWLVGFIRRRIRASRKTAAY